VIVKAKKDQVKQEGRQVGEGRERDGRSQGLRVWEWVIKELRKREPKQRIKEGKVIEQRRLSRTFSKISERYDKMTVINLLMMCMV
jgi:hypothetical protein